MLFCAFSNSAIYAQTPGGVSAVNLNVWLKADVGTGGSSDGDNCTGWVDQSGQSNDYTIQNNPTYELDELNYNPAVYVDATGPEAMIAPADNGGDLTDDWTIFTVAERLGESGDGNGRLFVGNSGNYLWGYHTTYEGAIYIDGNPNLISGGSTVDHSGANDTLALQTFIRNDTDEDVFVRKNGRQNYEDLTSTKNTAGISININDGYGSEDVDANVGELIIFNETLADDEIYRVECYLALKYGITLSNDFNGDGDFVDEINSAGFYEGDYVLSDSTIVWDYSTTGATYQFDIAGIGRDDGSGLGQVKSKSESWDAIVTIEADDEGTNLVNDFTDIADKEFLVWGNDDATTKFATAFSSGTMNYRMTRIWAVQETGDVGTVKVAILQSDWPDNVSLPYLIVSGDNDTDFDEHADDSETAMSAETINSVDYYTCTINLETGDYFTFAGFATFPGGVGTGLELWLKPDDETVGNATSWTDVSGNGNNFTTVASDPEFITGASGKNFNKMVTYDGDDRFSLTSFTTGFTEGELFNVLQSSGSSNFYASHFGGDQHDYYDNGNLDNYFSFGTTSRMGWRWTDGTPLDGTERTDEDFDTDKAWDPDDWQITNIYAESNNWGFTTNAYLNASTGENTVSFAGDGNNYIGHGRGGYFTGNQGEVILYSQVVTATERQKINTYLAIKYGITLSNDNDGDTNTDELITGTIYEGDYVDTDGNIIWDASAASSAYHYDVAGIGRDDKEALNQKQSKSENSDAIFTIGLGTIAADNAANANTFNDDGDYLIWGNDNADANKFGFTTGELVTATYTNRITREWKIQVSNGFAENVSIKAPWFTSDAEKTYYILWDADNDFSDGDETQVGALDSDGELTGITLASGYITIAAIEVDTDSDGITNLNDIDDDNDGIADRNDEDCETEYAWATWASVAADNMSATGSFTTARTGAVTVDITSTQAEINLVETRDWDGYAADVKSTMGAAYDGAIRFQGGEDAEYTVTFSEPVVNPSIAFWSFNGQTYTFDTPFEVASDTSGHTITSEYEIFGSVNNNTIILQFRGTHSVIKFTTSIYEFYQDITVGAGDCVIDTDGDGINNTIDIDSDNDGITDNVEAQTTDGYIFPSGIEGAMTDADNDGLDANYDADDTDADWRYSLGLTPVNTESTGDADYLDDDSDDDGTDDIVERGDGQATTLSSTTDTDSDGLYDIFEDGTTNDGFDVNDQNLDGSNDFSFADTDNDVADDGTDANGMLANFDYRDMTPGSPGGVGANLKLWLKVDSGVEESDTSTPEDGEAVTSWKNQDVAGVAFTTSSDAPTYSTSSSEWNYNPSILFNGNDDLECAVPSLFDATDPMTAYFVFNTNDATNKSTLMESSSGGDDPAFEINVDDNNGTFGVDLDGTDFQDDGYHLSQTITTGTNYITTTAFDNEVAGTGLYNYLNGAYKETQAGDTDLSVSTGALAIGSNGGGEWFDGDIVEIIIFDEFQTNETDNKKIHSYLAIKYGITLSNNGAGTNGDYQASDGTVVWDADANSGNYHNDVIVIGRDDASDLSQKQSTTTDDSLQVYVGSLVASNALNAGTITNDKSFIAIGHDGGTQQGQTTDVPSGIESRLSRVWKVTNTNFDDNFSVHIEWDSVGDFDISHIQLLVDSDGTFANATVLGTGDGLTFSNGSVIISGITTTHVAKDASTFFTFGSNNSSTPLPIELLSFTAEPNGNVVDLDWSTASEISNDYFTIERSEDGISFEAIATVGGAGNSTSILYYTTVDYAPLDGISYYRLKQTDYDGKFEYSEIRSVNFNAISNGGKPSIIISPNPAKGSSEVNVLLSNFAFNSDVRIVLRDNISREYFTGNVTTNQKGTATLKLNSNTELAAGIYFVTAYSSVGEFVSSIFIVTNN